jgi:hypothetical protein
MGSVAHEAEVDWMIVLGKLAQSARGGFEGAIEGFLP